ncbi:MAG: rhodanese-like domain-containing protein [Chloroflexota bacterium]
MFDPRRIPEIQVHDLAAKLASSEDFVLLDVREEWELVKARIMDARLVHAPMSQLSAQGTAALPGPGQSPERSVYVLCHHGVRSAQVTDWLIRNGWTNVFNVHGGIDQYAHEIDPRVGFY